MWGQSTQKALIVIPEEAELIAARSRMTFNPKIVLIVYSAPVTKRMTHFSNLDYYVLPSRIPGFVVPDWLSIDLGIFAGRAYMKFDEIEPFATYLREAHDASWRPTTGEKHLSKSFTERPHDFLAEWLAVRRHGQDITHTPLGYVLNGRKMSENHPFFTKHHTEQDGSDSGSTTRTPTTSSEDDPEDTLDEDVFTDVEDEDEFEDEIWKEEDDGEDVIDEVSDVDGDDV